MFPSVIDSKLVLILILIASESVNNCKGSSERTNNEIYGTNVLEQIGCAKFRRLLALKVLPEFPNMISPDSVLGSGEGGLAFSPQSASALPRIAFSSENLPVCRRDRPDLYAARQCNALDCFCVNVTTGEIFLGTRTGSEDLVDCSTAVLKLHLVVLQSVSSSLPRTFQRGMSSLSSSSSSCATSFYTKPAELDSHWESRIHKALSKLCHASTGFQRVASVKRLPSSNGGRGNGRTIIFEVLLYSTGHGRTLASLEELIKHRLDEAYLPELGSIDPEDSYLERVEESMPDPEPDFRHHLDLVTAAVGTKAEMELGNVADVDGDLELGAIFTGSEGGRDPPQQDYPGSNRRRPISVRQTAHDLAVQNSWRHREILNQPGVIAAIVGSTIAGLLLLILLILFCIYRLRKKDEGSYSLEEPQKGPTSSSTYLHPSSREFYA